MDNLKGKAIALAFIALIYAKVTKKTDLSWWWIVLIGLSPILFLILMLGAFIVANLLVNGYGL